MYEHKSEPLAPREVYTQRLITSGSVGIALVSASLAVGIAGYSYFESIGIVDAFLNASMILSGMGPLLDPKSVGGKLFAGFYALYSGFAVLAIAGVIFAPVAHRIMHRFHIEQAEAGARARQEPESGKQKPAAKGKPR
ncbi:MAG: hypothetical protein ACXWGU_16450 [Usitatibacter sp.]